MNEKIHVQNLLENNWRLKCCISKLQYHCEVYKLGLCSIHKILEGESKEGEKSVTHFSARGNCANKLILLSQRKALNKISGIIRKAKIFINGYSLLKDHEPVERISAEYNIRENDSISSPNTQKQKRKKSSESKSFQEEYSTQITKTDAGNVNSENGSIKREDTNAKSSSNFHRQVVPQHLDVLVHKKQHMERNCANQQLKEEMKDKSQLKKENCPNNKVSKLGTQIVDDGTQIKWKDMNRNLHPQKFENKTFDKLAIKFGTSASDSQAENQQKSRIMSKSNEFCGNRNKNISFWGNPFVSRPTIRQTLIHKDEQQQKRSQVYKPRLSSSPNNNNNVAHSCYKATYSNKLRVGSESSRHGSEINRRWGCDSKRKQRNDVNVQRFGQQNKRQCWKKEEKHPTDEYQPEKVRRVNVYPENEGYYFGKAGKMVIRPHYSSDLADKRAQKLIQPQRKLYKSPNENPNATSTFASSPLKGIEMHSNNLSSDLITPNNQDGIEEGGSATTPTFSNIPLIPEEDAGTYLPDPRLCKNRKEKAKPNHHIII